MAATNVKSKAELETQKACIDLPGEAVKCWRSSGKIQVILRKHRDVIFELKLARDRTYTVESTGSDFYNANAKKLIYGRNVERVSFSDGERIHLWIARDFTGELVLKSAGTVILKLEPKKFDARQYDDEPKTKPMPIIIALGASSLRSDAKLPKSGQQLKAHLGVSHQSIERSVADAGVEDCALVCVVDGNIEGIPRDIWESLMRGGGTSGLTDLDPNNIATRNWLLGQLAGASAYAGDNWKWLRASLDNKTHTGFKLVKAKIHYVKGKARFFFSGYSRHNAVFGPGGFGAGHDRIMRIFGGAGDGRSVLKATAQGVAGSFKNCALVSFIFGSATALAEWKADASKDGYDLAAALITNVIKSVVAATLTVAIVACVLFLVMFVMEIGLSVAAVSAITITAGVVVGYGIDVADKALGRMVVGESHQDGLSAVLAEHMRQSVQYHWRYLKSKFSLDYEGDPL